MIAVLALKVVSPRSEAGVRVGIADEAGVDLVETDWRCRERGGRECGSYRGGGAIGAGGGKHAASGNKIEIRVTTRCCNHAAIDGTQASGMKILGRRNSKVIDGGELTHPQRAQDAR